MSLYKELKANGIPIDNHESDLYFKRTDESVAILAKYPLQKSYARSFPALGGETWVDVPFAYDPFWEARGMR